MKGDGFKCDNCGEFAFMEEREITASSFMEMLSERGNTRKLPEGWFSLAWETDSAIDKEVDTHYGHFCSVTCLSFYSGNVIMEVNSGR